MVYSTLNNKGFIDLSNIGLHLKALTLQCMDKYSDTLSPFVFAGLFFRLEVGLLL